MLKCRIGLLLIVLGVGYSFHAHAQQGQFGNQTLPWYFFSPQDLQNRIDELSKPSIPTNELALTREIDRLDNEIISANSELYRFSGFKEWDTRFEDLIKKLRAAELALSQVDCEQINAFRKALGDYNVVVGSLTGFFQNPQGVDFGPLTLPPQGGTESESCKIIQDEFSKLDSAAKLDPLFAAMRKLVEDGKYNAGQTVDQYSKLIRLIRDRRGKLQDALNTDHHSNRSRRICLQFL